MRKPWKLFAGAAAVAAILLGLAQLPVQAAGGEMKTVPGITQITGNVVVQTGTRVDGDVALTTGQVTVEEGAVVDGQVKVATGRIEIRGEVTGDVQVATGSIRVLRTGVVKGEARTSMGDVQVDEGGQVRSVRQAVGSSHGEGNSVIDASGIHLPGLEISNRGVFLPGLSIDPSGIKGFGLDIGPHGVRYNGSPVEDGSWRFFSPFRGPSLFFHFFSWAGLFALSLLVVALLPRQVGAMASALQLDPVKYGLWGLLIWVLLVPVLVLSIITIIGLPVLLVLFLLAKLVGYVALAVLVGQLIGRGLNFTETRSDQFMYLLIGSLAIALVGVVPGVSWLVHLVGGCLGVGVAILTRFGTRVPLSPSTPAA